MDRCLTNCLFEIVPNKINISMWEQVIVAWVFGYDTSMWAGGSGRQSADGSGVGRGGRAKAWGHIGGIDSLSVTAPKCTATRSGGRISSCRSALAYALIRTSDQPHDQTAERYVSAWRHWFGEGMQMAASWMARERGTFGRLRLHV
eukprot:1475594-Prymnesium_polylepis.1